MFLMILTSTFHERIFWVIIFGVIIFKKPKVIKKHFLNLPEPPLILDLTIMKKAKKKQTKIIQTTAK